jgi:hypothetical protein
MGNFEAKARSTRLGNRSSVLRLAVGTALSAALTFGMLSAADAKSKVRTTMDGAVQYGCQGTCDGRYMTCLQSGQSYQYCATIYMSCTLNCR